MLHKHFRPFSVLQALKALKLEAESHSKKSHEAFMSSYTSYVKKNYDDLYCFSSKLTPSQIERVDILSDELLKLTPMQHRVFMFLLIENEKKNFNYRPLYKEAPNRGEVLWTDHAWPSVHPTNLAFQKEMDEFGLVGYNGLPAEFVEKLKSGEAVQKIEIANRDNS